MTDDNVTTMSRLDDGTICVHWGDGQTEALVSRELLDQMVADFNKRVEFRRWFLGLGGKP